MFPGDIPMLQTRSLFSLGDGRVSGVVRTEPDPETFATLVGDGAVGKQGMVRKLGLVTVVTTDFDPTTMRPSRMHWQRDQQLLMEDPMGQLHEQTSLEERTWRFTERR